MFSRQLAKTTLNQKQKTWRTEDYSWKNGRDFLWSSPIFEYPPVSVISLLWQLKLLLFIIPALYADISNIFVVVVFAVRSEVGGCYYTMWLFVILSSKRLKLQLPLETKRRQNNLMWGEKRWSTGRSNKADCKNRKS